MHGVVCVVVATVYAAKCPQCPYELPVAGAEQGILFVSTTTAFTEHWLRECVTSRERTCITDVRGVDSLTIRRLWNLWITQVPRRFQ
jgi:hypothetical protein